MATDVNFPDEPIFLDLPITRGDTFGPQIVRLKYEDGSLVDLTGYDIRIVYNLGCCGVIQATANGSLTVSNPAGGEVPLYLPKSATWRLPLGQRARWALKTILKDTSNGEQEKTLFVGRLIVNEGADWHG